MPRELKSALLLELLKRPEVRSVLAFTRTKHRANRLADFLARHGVASDRIHGNRSQAQRTQALARFKGGQLSVLVATDIAARGIDITGLSHVVNFDVPAVPEDYIHRVGRTARMDALGDALSLVAPGRGGGFPHHRAALSARASSARRCRASTTGSRPAERFEVPLADRIASIRARKADDRARGRANAQRRARPVPLAR